MDKHQMSPDKCLKNGQDGAIFWQDRYFLFYKQDNQKCNGENQREFIVKPVKSIGLPLIRCFA